MMQFQGNCLKCNIFKVDICKNTCIQNGYHKLSITPPRQAN